MLGLHAAVFAIVPCIVCIPCSITYIAIKLCHYSSYIAVYYREKNEQLVMEQFMGLTCSDNRESTWTASPQTAAAHSQIDADRRKINFPSEKVSGVNLLSLHSFVNYLGTFNSRTKTNRVTSFFQTQQQ